MTDNCTLDLCLCVCISLKFWAKYCCDTAILAKHECVPISTVHIATLIFIKWCFYRQIRHSVKIKERLLLAYITYTFTQILRFLLQVFDVLYNIL